MKAVIRAVKAVIYARISHDKEGEGLGTERQLQDCRELIQAKGWTLAGEYVDNDISAFSGAKRPAFERMLQDAQDVDTVVVWKSDRLARRGRDLQRFLDTGATLTSCTEPEFTGSTGLLMLRILSGFAEHESGVKSERIARKMREKAERGDPHAGGPRTYGFTADGRSLVPEEAARLQEATQRVLAGESLTAICEDWDRRGVTTTNGGRWLPSNLGRLLQSPRMVGMREYHGELFPGKFYAVIDQAAWERMRATLRARRKGPNARRHLLTGLLVCGRCGASMVGGSGSGKQTAYVCLNKLRGGCGRTAINASRIEPYVVGQVLARIPAMGLGAPDPSEATVLAEIRSLEADLAQLSKDHYVNKIISRPTFLAANNEIEAQLEALRSQLAAPKHRPISATLETDWPGMSMSARQAVLRAALVRVTIVPGLGTRPPMDERRVQLTWTA